MTAVNAVTRPPEPGPLSKSGLYPALREFYRTLGAQAWAGTVPLHVTCNPNLADFYATVIVRFILDALATGRADIDEPFYVAEIGAGSGKFGFHLVKRVGELRQALSLEHVRIIHVMTDMAESNVAHWARHPRLRPYLERGDLVLARFDAETDQAFRLMPPDEGGTGDELAEFANPLTVIANYVFDSLPQDLFRVVDGRLEALWATAGTGDTPESVRLSWSPRPVSFPHYGDDELDELLAWSTLRPETAPQAEPEPQPGSEPESVSKVVIFPVAALQLLRRLADAAGGRLCLLASDLGRGAKTVGRGTLSEPELELKDSGGFFFLPVDLDVVGQFFARLGPAFNCRAPSANLDTSFSICGFAAEELVETRHAFSTLVELFGRRGLGAMASLLHTGVANLKPEDWLGVAAIVGHDSSFLDMSVDLIPGWIKNDLLDSPMRHEVIAALQLFGAEIYWTPGAPDSYFNLGTALMDLGDVRGALSAYLLAIESYGPTTDTYINMALGLRAMNRRAEAVQALRGALAVDPAHVVARGWLGRVQLELAGELPVPGRPPV